MIKNQSNQIFINLKGKKWVKLISIWFISSFICLHSFILKNHLIRTIPIFYGAKNNNYLKYLSKKNYLVGVITPMIHYVHLSLATMLKIEDLKCKD